MACGRTLFSRVIGRVRRWKMFQPLRMVVLLDGESGESEEALEVMDSKPGVYCDKDVQCVTVFTFVTIDNL